MRSGRSAVGIERSNGSFLAYYGLLPVYDPAGTSTVSERFATLDDAARFIGWPVGIVDFPPELAALATA